VRGTVEVHQHLVERGIRHEFYRLERPLRRIDEAAALLGLPPSQVAAVELFEAAAALPIVAVVPADGCASADAVASAAGARRVWPAPAARVTELTGYLPGWLPPIGHERAVRVVLDPALLSAEVVYAPGGDPGVMLVMRSTDLARATSATMVPLATPGAAVAPSEALELPAV
jgi:prolyl-tRNA editing enzyme YbaK/EbsC (Cys-tRNA(Pro) deacylase)